MNRRRSAREIRKRLRSIYEGADGRMPDLTKLERGERSKLTRFLLKTIGLLAIISAISWVGFFVFTRGLFQDNETLKLSIEGPEQVKSGEEVSYTFRYENIGAVPVASLVMKLNLPSTFHIYSTVPEPTASNEWTIGSLSDGSDGVISVTGVFLAEVPSSQRLQALFTYKPANFSSDFQDIVTYKVDIEDSVLALSLTGPEKALVGDVSEYVVNIQNTGLGQVFNVRVTPLLPTDFTLEESLPSLEEGLTYFVIDALEPGELAAITIKGKFTSTASGEQRIVTSVGFVEDDLVLSQGSEEVMTDVLGGSVSFSVIVNGSSQSQSVDLGETLRVSIDYANESEEVVDDMELDLSLSSEDGALPVDWNRASTGGGGRSGDEIHWDGLGPLEPGSSHVIDLALPIFSNLDASEADRFTLSVVLTLNKVGSIASTRTLEATPIVIALNSDVWVNAQARYYSADGIAIGAGPIPPRVGETTSYRIYWNIQNSLHTLEDVRVSTTLPQDIAWLESTDTSIGDIGYNSTTRQLTWTIPKLLSELGSAGAWFEVAINPDSSDVGRFMRLTNSTSFEAKDSVTNESLSDSLDEITTELPYDDFALGKGVVIE